MSTGSIEPERLRQIAPSVFAELVRSGFFKQQDLNTVVEPVEADAAPAAPVKILSSQEQEAARAATVRAGGYEHTPSMFDATSTKGGAK